MQRLVLEVKGENAVALADALTAAADRLRRGIRLGDGEAGSIRILDKPPEEIIAPADAAPLQERVRDWLIACFGDEIAMHREERADRLLEEVFELLQSGGYDPSRIASLRDYVWSRNIGEPHQETGGVMLTLAAYCEAHGLDMAAAAEEELGRVWTKIEKIRAKQAAKPVGSALPQHWATRSAPIAPEDLRVLVRSYAAKHGKPAGTPYEEGSWDMAMRIIGAIANPDLPETGQQHGATAA